MKRFAQLNLMALAACVALASSAQAQPPTERLTLKFDTPVMVPGATLPAGTYVFKEQRTTQDVLEIYNEDETRVLATALTIPAKRDEVTGEAVVTIQRTSPQMAPALSKVFYPGNTYGHEFVYSEERARELAEETKKIVLAHDAPEGSDMDALGRARLWRTGPGGQRTEFRREQATAETARRSGAEQRPAQTADPSRAEQRPAQTADRSRTEQRPGQMTAGRSEAEQHLTKIEQLVDRMLQSQTQAVGTTGQTQQGQILVERAQLEQIKRQLNELRQELKQQHKR